jgi:hypothetical protein
MPATMENIGKDSRTSPFGHRVEVNETRWQLGSVGPVPSNVASEQPQPTVVRTASLAISSLRRANSVDQHRRESEEAESPSNCQRWQADEEAIGNTLSMRQSIRARKVLVPITTPQNPTTKRKLPQNHGQSYQKRNKTQRDYDKKELALFKEMDHVDQDIIEARDIYQRLLHKCPSANDDIALFLVRLFYAIASPQAFALLKDAFTTLKTENEIIVPQSTNTAAQTIKALNALDTAATVQSLLRRFHLVRLHALRVEKEEQYELEKPQRHAMKSRLRKRKVQRTYESSSSLAINDLMAEAYPHLERPVRMRDAAGTEYGRRHTALKHMLVAGRNWHTLQRRFSSGVLALIPTGREYGIQNSEYVASFVCWLQNLLQQYRTLAHIRF